MNVTIYGSPSCSSCKNAVALCEERGIVWDYIDLSTKPEAMMEVSKKIGSFKSVPQIFVDGRHVGGLKGFIEDLDS